MDFQDFLRDTWQTSFIFACLFLFTRVLGKTQIGQLTFYEYISGITIGSIAGNIVAAEPDKFWSNFYDLTIFVILTYLLSYVTLKNRSIRDIIEGKATVVVEKGVILKDSMRELRYDLEELTTQLRQQGVFDINEVQYAILETTGDLSVIKKSSEQPATKSDMNIAADDPMYPVELIMDGVPIPENLGRKNLSMEWLESELATRGINDMNEVLYAVIDSKGNLFINKG